MLAFSSIGQLGMVFIAFSLPGEIGVLAGLAVALHHLVIKSGLFALSARWGSSMDALAGLGRRSPLAGAIYVLFVLSMIGVPPLPGFWAKLVVLIALAQQGPLELAAMAAILVVTAIEATYLFRLAVILFSRGEPEAAPAGPKPSSAVPAPSSGAGLVAPLLALTLLVATVAIGPVTDGLRVIARQTVDVGVYVRTVFPPAQAPLAQSGPTAAVGLEPDLHWKD
jgi:formate hydrogenlyase subunit 3/multisubunit Na+/H+ antiporter MnhD subunit